MTDTNTKNAKNIAIHKQIAERLVLAGDKFHAADNISKHLKPGELELLQAEVTDAFAHVLDTLVIDRHNDPNSQGTAKRLAKMYLHELLRGRYYPAPEVTSFPNVDKPFNGLLVVRAELKSMCSHHHQIVDATAYIGLIPTNNVIGLSKYARIAQWCARRGTLQEELANDIANEIMKATKSENVGVYIEGTHGCMENRGVMAHSSLTQTTVLHGLFHNASVKDEFMHNIRMQKSHA